MPHHCRHASCRGGACFTLPTPACGRILSQLLRDRFLGCSEPLLRPDHRQDDLRGVAAAEVDGVFGNPPAPVIVERLTRVRVYVKAREVTARDIDANAVPALRSEERRVGKECRSRW